MKYSILLLLLLGSSILALGASNRSTNISNGDPVKKIVRAIAKSDVFETPVAFGNSNSTSRQEQRFNELSKMASIEELTQLATQHRKAVVRLYAFQALVQKQKNIPREIMDQINNDQEMVMVLKGNVAEKKPFNLIANGFLY